MKKKDLKFIIETIKGNYVDYKPDWYSVLGFLSLHKVEGLFYNRAKKLNINIPYKIEKTLENKFISQKKRNVLMRQYVDEISRALIKSDVKHILLKGSVLSNLSEECVTIYEDGERVSNDIDLLVRYDSISEAANVLKNLGFVQGRYCMEDNEIVLFERQEIIQRRMNRGEVAPFVKKTNNLDIPFIEIDINFSLGNTPSERQDVLSQILSTAHVFNGKVKMSVPEEELFFLHLIMHQYKESTLYFMVERNKDLDLYKLADIYYMIKQKTIDLTILDDFVKKFKLENQLGVVLKQVGEIFDDEKILLLAKKYYRKKPIVIDYSKNKLFKWDIENVRRITNFDSVKFLREVQRDK